MTVKTAVTDEQIAAARDALEVMGKAAGVLQAIVSQLGWEDIDEEWQLEELGADQSVQDFFAYLDSCANPGHDMITAIDLARIMQDELDRRVLAQQFGFKP